MERKLVSYVYLLNNIIKFLLFDSIRIERYYYPWLRKRIITNPKSLENIKVERLEMFQSILVIHGKMGLVELSGSMCYIQ